MAKKAPHEYMVMTRSRYVRKTWGFWYWLIVYKPNIRRERRERRNNEKQSKYKNKRKI